MYVCVLNRVHLDVYLLTTHHVSVVQTNLNLQHMNQNPSWLLTTRYDQKLAWNNI